MSPEEPKRITIDGTGFSGIDTPIQTEPKKVILKPKEFTVPENTGNVKMAILRDIYPNAPRKQLRKLLKNKKFMKELDIKVKPKD